MLGHWTYRYIAREGGRTINAVFEPQNAVRNQREMKTREEELRRQGGETRLEA